MARVYVAGPYTQGDVALNVRRAIEAGHLLLEAGHIPYIPHLTHFWHLVFPRPYEDWLDLDNKWLPMCHGVLRLAGESSGADKEVALAVELKMPVFLEAIEYFPVSLEMIIEDITKYWEVID